MPINTISPEKLSRLIGTHRSPALIDVRGESDFASAPYLVPSSVRRSFATFADWIPGLRGQSTIVICRDGSRDSHGIAATLRHAGVPAETLEGGFAAWKKAGLPCIPTEKLPARDRQGRTLWVTRERPKVDRIACAWLIRRFVDPFAVFLFVAPAAVAAVAEQFGAAPFDVTDAFWSHRGDKCTFDTMVEEFGLSTDALQRLAVIVRGADTARLDLAPEAPGLLAASLGLSRLYADDLEQLEAGLLFYDSFFRWCRDAADETHTWPPKKA